MTKNELIATLQTIPGNPEVLFIDNDRGGYLSIEEVKLNKNTWLIKPPEKYKWSAFYDDRPSPNPEFQSEQAAAIVIS